MPEISLITRARARASNGLASNPRHSRSNDEDGWPLGGEREWVEGGGWEGEEEYAGGSMGEPTLTEETAFSPRRFVLFAFFLSISSGSVLSLSLSFSLGKLPARERASSYLHLLTLVLPRCTCRAHESGREWW